MRRGEAREKIITAAERLFAERWYSTVSVADICRTAGVSNGIAYHYFNNKEELLVDLMDRTIQVVDAAPSLNGSNDPDVRIYNYINDLLGLTVDRKHLIRAFRQGQYRMISYEQKLHDLYSRHLAKVLGRAPSDLEYVFTLSGLRFVNIRHAFDSGPADRDTLFKILKEGIFPGDETRPLDDFLPRRILPPAVDLIMDNRAKLISAGKSLFGERDFASVSIADITERAGISVGAFYRHFESKDSFLAEIVKGISRELRRFISLNMPECQSSLEEELAGIYLFCVYLSFDPACYPVVRQAEYVVPEVTREYYDGFLRGYLKRRGWPPGGYDPGTVANFCIGIAHYVGMEFSYSASHKDIKALLEGLIVYYKGGLGRQEV